MLHVSLRTVHNWFSGRHQVPYIAYKLLRLLRYMELPGKSWEGWHFTRGMLVTPEGRTISGKDGSWWSLLVRQSRCYVDLAAKNQATQKKAVEHAKGSHASGDGGAAALIYLKNTTEPNSTIFNDIEQNNGAIMGSWPTISESRPPLTLKPVAAVSVSASASTPLFALHLMPISDSPLQSLPVLPAPFLPSRCLPLPMTLRYQLHQQTYPASSQSSNAGNSQPHSEKLKSTKTVQGGGL